MARRYHKLPSEILELDLLDFALNFEIMKRGLENDAEQVKEMTKDGGFVCPAWLLFLR
jgi:hypothetical protein